MANDYALTVLDDKIFGTKRSTGETMLVIDSMGDVSIGGSLSLTNPPWASEDILPSAYSPDSSCTIDSLPSPNTGYRFWKFVDPTGLVGPKPTINMYWTLPKDCSSSANTFYATFGFTNGGNVDNTCNNVIFNWSFAWASAASPLFTGVNVGGKWITLVNSSLPAFNSTSEIGFPITIPSGQVWPITFILQLMRNVYTSSNPFLNPVFLTMAQIKYPRDKLGQ